jgi:hypothetical protein
MLQGAMVKTVEGGSGGKTAHVKDLMCPGYTIFQVWTGGR